MPQFQQTPTPDLPGPTSAPTTLLTFLGTGNYQRCQYSFNGVWGNSHELFSVVLAEHLRPDSIISLQTVGAAEKHGSTLDSALSSLNLSHKAVPIPEGRSEPELWKIFAALTDNVPANCTLHLDITHGFRSLPVLGFIALSYLRVTRNVTIGGIYYGAWEAREAGNGPAPTFDLTPFLSLLDWTAAADQFFATGSATRLGQLLANTQQSLWKNCATDNTSNLPKLLKNLGSRLNTASQNLLLLRTGALPASSSDLQKTLAQAKTEMAEHASPFLELLQPVKKELTRFNSTDLPTLRDLVGWLAERGQTASALTLASEWITSYVMVLCGNATHHSGYNSRKAYSLALNLLETPDLCLQEDEFASAARNHLATLGKTLTTVHLDHLKKTLSTIRNARNDLNHAGFNQSPANAESLIRRSKEVGVALQELPLPQNTP